MPTACSLPEAAGEIFTYFHAGGIARDLIREIDSSSVILVAQLFKLSFEPFVGCLLYLKLVPRRIRFRYRRA